MADLMGVQSTIQHIPTPVKNVGDGTAILTTITAFVTAMNPIVEFAMLGAGGIWMYFRIQDLRLASKLKQKELDK